MHEEVKTKNELRPETVKGTCIAIGLFVDDTHAVMAKAVAAGAVGLDPVQHYGFDYRENFCRSVRASLGCSKKIGK